MVPASYSLYAIPVAWVLAALPQAFSLYTFNSHKGPRARGWNNANPRTNYTPESFKANGIPAHIADRIVRATSASSNGLENLALFAAGVVAGNYAQLPARTLNTICLTYLLSRCLYNILYIRTTTQRRSHWRSVVFYIGHGAVMMLFIQSGKVLAQRSAAG